MGAFPGARPRIGLQSYRFPGVFPFSLPVRPYTSERLPLTPRTRLGVYEHIGVGSDR